MDKTRKTLKDIASFKLAVLLHDPPWKPWGIRRSGYAIDGCSGSYDECIAWHVATLARKVASGYALPEPLAGIIETLSGGAEKERIVRGLEAAAEAAEKWRSEALSKISSHERQSLLLLRVLEAALRGAGLRDYSRVAGKAAKILAGEDERELRRILHQADVLASAFDRAYLTLLYGDEESSSGEARSQVYVNTFNPARWMSVGRVLGVDKVAGYIVSLVAVVLYFLLKAENSSNKSKDHSGGKDLLLYNLVYSVLEPLWYLTFGPGYVPVADTRVPNHTVFDHAAAAAMVANWLLDGEKPRGCLAIVDLKSVQMWIGESRRLRDTWAASWLASWLAWETVKPLVEEYGPDVLIQPPARLHPFYASWLLSRLGCNNAMDGPCGWLARLLALPHGWPLDPTVPTMARLALPENVCTNILETVSNAYTEAWRKISRKIADYINDSVNLAKEVEKACRSRGGCKALKDKKKDKKPVIARILARDEVEEEDVIGAVEYLEPPLPLQVRTRSLEEARRKAAKVAEKAMGCGLKVAAEKISDMLLYQVLVDDRFWEDEERLLTGFRATGRRSGQAYLNYARGLYEVGRRVGERLFYNCHVCGAGAAIVDGEELWVLLRAAKETQLDNSDNRVKIKERIGRVARLARNVQGERLCPYCLAKRMLRDMLYYDELARELVGLKMPRAVYERLGRVTVNYYTSRLRRNAEYLAYEVSRLVKDYSEALMWLYSIGFTAPNRFIKPLLYPDKPKEYDEYVKKLYKDYWETLQKRGSMDENRLSIDLFEKLVTTAEALVMETVHDLAVPRLLREEAGKAGEGVANELRKLADKLESIVENVAGRRVYVLVLSDGDRMGSGVLSGRLSMKPAEYARRVAEAAGLSCELVDELAGFYEKIVKVYEDYFPDNRRYVDRTVIVTPSYHQAVSRALAAQGVLDREVVEKLGGLFLYSGGDDATAILPPIEPDREHVCVAKKNGASYRAMEPLYPALAAAAAMRRLYWGLTPLRTRDALSERLLKALGERETEAVRASSYVAAGFNTVTLGASSSVVAVVPALAVYGRSTVVYYAGVKEPFWSVFSKAHWLLDEKDHTLFINKEGCMKKDAFIVAGYAGAALLPLSSGRYSFDAAAAVEGTIRLLRREAWRILELNMQPGQGHQACPRLRGVTASLFSDARLYAVEALEAALQGRGDAVEKLIEYLVSRNIAADAAEEVSSEVSEILLRGVANGIGGVTAVSVYAVEEHGVLREFLVDGFSCKASCYIGEEACRCSRSEEGEWLASSSLFQVFNAARITRSAR